MGKLRILSHSSEPFTDRAEAGRLLADALPKCRIPDVVVLGIPRGGVVIARELARGLGAELDIVLARKLGAPGYPELAMGSVSEDGKLFLNQEVLSTLAIDDAVIQAEKARQMAEIKRRVQLIRSHRPKVSLNGKTAIVTDDGIATGATFQAACWAARHEKPAKLIAAIAVGPEETLETLARDVDELVCLRAPPYFGAVGYFYMHFEPVEDEQVLEILDEEQQEVEHKEDILREVERLAQKTGVIFIATADSKGKPYIAVTGALALTPEKHLVIADWFCPDITLNLQANPRLALVVWDPAAGTGYQLFGELEEMKDTDIHFAPQVAEKGPVAHVGKQLLIHVDNIIPLTCTPHSN